MGGANFAKLGTERTTPARASFSLSGHVKRPGVITKLKPARATIGELIKAIYEVRQVVMQGWPQRLKAVIPGGSSCPQRFSRRAMKFKLKKKDARG